MSLYLKYRPNTFGEVVGNEELVAVLKGMLDQGVESMPHSYLFSGPTGCGKTTLGRILAKELGAVGVDFREIDSADFRGIDTVREVRKQVQFSPLEGRCQVWVIDECHKMTNDAQNAFLKLLEDTPKTVYFILCTTDPAKLLPTVRGRCSSFQVNILSDDNMMSLLKKVVREEDDNLARKIYEQIVMDSQGHPRNALQILDQVLRVDSNMRLATAQRAAEEQSQSIELCRALLNGATWQKVSAILRGLKDQDAEGIRRHVLGYAQSVLLRESNDKAAGIIEAFYEPFYNIGFPGLVYSCYSVTK